MSAQWYDQDDAYDNKNKTDFKFRLVPNYIQLFFFPSQLPSSSHQSYHGPCRANACVAIVAQSLICCVSHLQTLISISGKSSTYFNHVFVLLLLYLIPLFTLLFCLVVLFLILVSRVSTKCLIFYRVYYMWKIKLIRQLSIIPCPLFTIFIFRGKKKTFLRASFPLSLFSVHPFKPCTML